MKSYLQMLRYITGQDNRLTITVNQNVPRVECTPSDKPPVALMCERVLYDMPASKAQEVFGNHGTAGVDVHIPWNIGTRRIHILRKPFLVIADWRVTAGFACVVKLRMTAGISGGPAIKTSWYRIWQQVVALTRLCSQAGKAGQAYIYSERFWSFLEDGKLTKTVGRSGQQRITISIVNEARGNLAISASDGTSQQKLR